MRVPVEFVILWRCSWARRAEFCVKGVSRIDPGEELTRVLARQARTGRQEASERYRLAWARGSAGATLSYPEKGDAAI
jgi:hypothetical protein